MYLSAVPLRPTLRMRAFPAERRVSSAFARAKIPLHHSLTRSLELGGLSIKQPTPAELFLHLSIALSEVVPAPIPQNALLAATNWSLFTKPSVDPRLCSSAR